MTTVAILLSAFVLSFVALLACCSSANTCCRASAPSDYGPRRFGELRRDLDPVSSKVLTAKLRALEAEGLVLRRVIDASPPQVEYALSARGRAFDPVFEAMVKVAAKLDRLDAAERRRQRKA